MKCKYVLLAEYIAAMAFVGYVTMTSFEAVNAETGAYTGKNTSALICFLTLMYFVINSFLTTFLHRCPLKAPEVTVPLVIGSAGVFVTLFLTSANGFLTGYTGFQTAVSLLASCAFGVFLVFYALTRFLHLELKKYIFVLPLLFWLIKLVNEYVKTAKMVLIPENAFKTLATAMTAVFFLYFAKYNGKVRSKQSHKLMLFFSFAAAASCEAFAIPAFYTGYTGVTLSNGNVIVRNSVYEACFYAMTGLFILIFVHSFFSNKNLRKHHSHSHSRVIIEDADQNESPKNGE